MYCPSDTRIRAALEEWAKTALRNGRVLSLNQQFVVARHPHGACYVNWTDPIGLCSHYGRLAMLVSPRLGFGYSTGNHSGNEVLILKCIDKVRGGTQEMEAWPSETIYDALKRTWPDYVEKVKDLRATLVPLGGSLPVRNNRQCCCRGMDPNQLNGQMKSGHSACSCLAPGST